MINPQIQEFFNASPKEQSILFPAFRREIELISKKVLWVEFRKVNLVLVDDCISFIFEKLIQCRTQIETGKERSFIYSVSKRYFQEWFFEKNAKTIFIEDLLVHDIPEHKKESDLEDLKIEIVENLKSLIIKSNDRNSLLILSSLIELILNEQDYNAQFASLYIYRKTGLKFDAVYNTIKAHKLKLSLSKEEYFQKIFRMYQSNAGLPEMIRREDITITEWERRAIEAFENHNERTRGDTFEMRHFRPTQKNKIKSTPTERVKWMIDNASSKNVERDYYLKFGMSYRSFKADTRRIDVVSNGNKREVSVTKTD